MLSTAISRPLAAIHGSISRPRICGRYKLTSPSTYIITCPPFYTTYQRTINRFIMPFYEVHHSCSLTQGQRQNLATAITRLHCEAFKTPAFLVHVRFFAEDNTDNTYFIAGKPHPRRSKLTSRGGGVTCSVFVPSCFYFSTELIKI